MNHLAISRNGVHTHTHQLVSAVAACTTLEFLHCNSAGPLAMRQPLAAAAAADPNQSEGRLVQANSLARPLTGSSRETGSSSSRACNEPPLSEWLISK